MTNDHPCPINRRAVLGAVLAAGAVAATALPAAALEAPPLSAVDRRVLDLWRRHQDLLAILDSEDGANDETGEEYSAIVGKIDEHLGASVLALAGALMVAIYDMSDEATPGLNLASLAAIRPLLVGAIADCAGGRRGGRVMERPVTWKNAFRDLETELCDARNMEHAF